MEDSLEQLRYPIGKYQKPEKFDPGKIQDWIADISALPGWLDACVENMDEHQLKTPYRPGGWTVIQTIHHIADSHMNAYIRFKLALTEDIPYIKPYSEALWAELPDVNVVPVNISLTLLHSLHRRWLAVLKNMKPADWERAYYHPEQKRNVPLWEAAALYAWHGRHHVEHIRRLRQRMNW